MEGQSAVQRVALAPQRAVEHHGWQQQQGAEAHQGPDAVSAGEAANQPQAAPGQQHVKKDGKELDKVQIGHRQIGDGGQEIEVGDVVVADGQIDGGKAAVVPEGGHPLGQEDLIVVRHIVQQGGPEEEGQPHGQQQSAQPIQRTARPAEQPEGQSSQGGQQHKDGGFGTWTAQGQLGDRKEGEKQQRQTSGAGGQGEGGTVFHGVTSLSGGWDGAVMERGALHRCNAPQKSIGIKDLRCRSQWVPPPREFRPPRRRSLPRLRRSGRCPRRPSGRTCGTWTDRSRRGSAYR